MRTAIVTLHLALFTFALLAPAFMIHPVSAQSTTYYVSGDGRDTNSGTNPTDAFRTIQRAANLTNPGDTVLLMNGTYTDYDTGGVLTITRSGSPGNPITYKAYPDHSPVLKPVESWNGILIYGASHIVIEGLEVYGNSENITLEKAREHIGDTSYAPTNTNCIFATDHPTRGDLSTHLTIRNNHIHHCPGLGIGSRYGDYITIENNLVHSTSWYTVYATSGISVLRAANTDDSTGYKIIIRNNIVYDNETFIPWAEIEDFSDGNGIIIDTNYYTDDPRGPYRGRTLVANNLVFANGGSGIHSYKSNHIDIVNNTAYLNSRSPELNYGNLYAQDSADVNILNNISYVRAGEPTNSNTRNTDVTYDYNIYFNGRTPAVMGPNDRIADPLFVAPSEDLLQANFQLQRGSPAIDSGTAQIILNTDLAGGVRPTGAGVDLGAYEFGSLERFHIYAPLVQSPISGPDR